MDWAHITFAIRSALLDAPSNHNDARNQSYRFGLEDVIVGTHIYRKLMVVPIESCVNFFIWSILFQNWIGQIAVLPW